MSLELVRLNAGDSNHIVINPSKSKSAGTVHDNNLSPKNILECTRLEITIDEKCSPGQLAVAVQEANLTFGKGKKAHRALNGVNLKVPKGSIYGLLGPSGCGKTTLLNVVIGCLKVQSGEVKVFGEKPCSTKSIVPGRGVGYMPQELALYQEFTIEETLVYFGRLQRLDTTTLIERIAFLIDFLDLPKRSAYIEKLSGGQQRRVSLAAALIHQPPLLILDEPTVGVDPLLRQTIWNHLVGLATREGMTIIVTTHYIEEAGQANVIGLMRGGQMLAEESPEMLKNRLQEKTLEKCFLKLCSRNAEPECEDVSSNTLLLKEESIQTSEVEPVASAEISNGFQRSNIQSNNLEHCTKGHYFKDSLHNIITLFFKNMKRLRRNIVLVMFHLILPSVLIIFLCLCIGPTPFDLTIAVVNDEINKELSINYLKVIDDRIIHQKMYPDVQSAMDSVSNGDTWGLIHIGPYFGESLSKRFEEGLYASNETIHRSSIDIYLDMTNQQVGITIQKTLMEAFQTFSRNTLKSVGSLPILADLPLRFNKPIYGSLEVSFTEFVAPGMNLNLAYFLAVALTVLSCVDERKSGLLNRSWVSGVTSVQVLSAQLLSQSLILAGQITGLFAFAFLVFDIPAKGPFSLVIVIIALQGIYGMSFGLLISALITNENMALMACLGSFYPSLFLSGLVWPLEGQPVFLRYVSKCLPQTIPTEALRAVLSRGWGIEYTVVWSSLLITLAWIGVTLIAAIVAFRLKK